MSKVENVIDELARIHALSWKHRAWLDCFPQSPGQEKFITEMKQVAQELAEVQPEVFAPLLDRASPLYTYECYKKCCYVEDKYGFPAALVHSDLWAPNILFETDMYEPVLSLV